MSELNQKAKAGTYDTNKHIREVQKALFQFGIKLAQRAIDHDQSKLGPEEAPLLAEMTPKLASLEYGSEEYAASLADLKPALDHHYANNRHHPEHWPNGVEGMNLVDLVEMFADWYASSKRQNDGNLRKSVESGAERFGISEQLAKILMNSIDIFDPQA